MKYCEIHYRDIWQKEEGVLIRNLIQTNPLDRIVREDAERARRCPPPPHSLTYVAAQAYI